MATATYTPSSLASRTASHLDELRQFKADQAWLNALWRQPSAALSAADKVVLVALRRHLAEQARRHPEATDYAVYVPQFAAATGLSESVVSSRLKHIEACRGIDRRHVTITRADGTRGTQLRIRPLPALDRPAALIPPVPRKHGGTRTRIACPECDSTDVKVEAVCTCRSCGTVSRRLVQDYEPDAAAADDALPDDGTDTQLACLENNHTERDEPALPVETSILEGGGGDTLIPDETAVAHDETTDKQLACRYLIELAGDGDTVEQQRRMTAKYLPAGDTFAAAMAAAHLDGTHTYGTRLQRADGRTLALCVESDDAAGTDVLAAAVLRLIETGAYAVLEQSPSVHHAGGAALWLFFAEPVDAAAARATMLHHAPELAAFDEHWPNGNGKRRLPCGRYVRPPLPERDGEPAQPAVDAWCRVEFADGDTLAGLDAMCRITRDERTPAAWVTVEPEPIGSGSTKGDAAAVSPCLVISTEPLPVATAPRVRPVALDDAVWQGRYGDKCGTMWYAFLDEFTVAWFNQHHRLTDILEMNADGYARAVWRDERTASVYVYADGTWCDFGKHGDWPATGDALDAWCLVYGDSKATVLAHTAHDILQTARRELEAAATASGLVPAWLVEITTPAGWRHYDELRATAASRTDT